MQKINRKSNIHLIENYIAISTKPTYSIFIQNENKDLLPLHYKTPESLPIYLMQAVAQQSLWPKLKNFDQKVCHLSFYAIDSNWTNLKDKKSFIIFGQYKTKTFNVRTQGLLRIHMQ